MRTRVSLATSGAVAVVLATLLTSHAPAIAQSTILNVNGEEVHIERDSHGVPRIVAETNHGLFAGMGYAVAEDRLWQLELNIRAGHGTLAEILGSGFLAADRTARRLGYTDAELDQQFASLSPEKQDIAAAYADGVNLYLSQVVAPDPAHKLPFEFHFLSLGVPAPVTTRDLIAFTDFTARTNLENGDQERTAQALLSNLVALHGPTDGLAIFDDVQWLFDPDAPASVPVDGANGPRPHPTPHPAASQLQGAGNPPDPDDDVEASLSAAGVPTRLGSHVWVVGPQWSTNGRAMLFGGPQLSLASAPTVVPSATPPQMLEVELDGGNGFHVRGITYPGLLSVIIGRNDHVAWSVTNALTANNVDTYVETVCGGGTGYLYQGNCVPFETRTEVIQVRGAAPENLTVERTIHGPVVASAPGVRFSRKSLERGRELENLSLDFDRAQNVQQFDEAVHRVVGASNFLYADNSGNIAYWRSGVNPVRPPGFDLRLPLPGDGSAEWTGEEQAVASSINPVRGWLTNWNNRATVDEESPDRAFGKQQRVQDIEDRLRAGPISLDDLIDIESDIARIGKDRGTPTSGAIGRSSRYLKPYLLQALDAVPSGHPLAAQARAVVEAWDGNRYADAVTSTTREAGEVIFSAWLDLMLPSTFADELGADVSRATPNMLIHVLDDALGGGSGVPPSRDYFNGQDPRLVMSNAFTQALNSLGPDPGAWSTKPRDVVHFRHALYPTVPEVGSMFDSDRDTYAQFVAFTDPIQAGNIFVLGQNAFIQLGPGNTPIVGPGITDLLDLYKAFQYKPMPITHRAGRAISFEKADRSRQSPVIERILQNARPGSIRIEFSTPAEGLTRLGVYDITGRRVARLLDGNLAAGAHAVDWNLGKAARSGVYLLRGEFGGQDVVRRIVVTR